MTSERCWDADMYVSREQDWSRARQPHDRQRRRHRQLHQVRLRGGRPDSLHESSTSPQLCKSHRHRQRSWRHSADQWLSLPGPPRRRTMNQPGPQGGGFSRDRGSQAAAAANRWGRAPLPPPPAHANLRLRPHCHPLPCRHAGLSAAATAWRSWRCRWRWHTRCGPPSRLLRCPIPTRCWLRASRMPPRATSKLGLCLIA